MNSSSILASIRLYRLDQAAHLSLVPSTLIEDSNIDVDVEYIVYITVVEEEVEYAAVAEAEAEEQFVIPIHYLVHMVMELYS